MTVDDFWSLVQKGDKCWLWNGKVDRDGYGRLYFDGKMQLAHRVSYQLVNGPITNGLYVLHHCDTPRCVNPNHLFLGTQADNIRDAVKKERLVKPPKLTGARNPNNKLSAEQVLEIRRRYVKGKVGAPTLAKEFGLNTKTVQQIVKRQVWRHI